MNRPESSPIPGGYRFNWTEESIQCEVLHIYQHKDGRVTAELNFKTSLPGIPPHLHQTQLNLLASRSKNQLAKDMGEKCPADWDTMIEQLCVISLQLIREGEPVITLRSSDEVKPLQYLVDPIIPQNMITTIFGEPGTAKSYTALMLAITSLLPWHDNPLGFGVEETYSQHVLYLDWETDEDEIRGRLKRLEMGMKLPELELHYRRCASALVDDADYIQQLVNDYNIKLVIVDSIGGACNGDLTDAAPALAMFRALRQLKVTCLLLGHPAKGETKTKSIYGSMFFTAYSRQIWECKKTQEAGDQSIDVGMYHRKGNSSGLHKPIGIHWDFVGGTTKFGPCNINDISRMLGELELKYQIQDILREQVLTIKEIAAEVGKSTDVVRATINENKHLFAHNGGVKEKKWGLLDSSNSYL